MNITEKICPFLNKNCIGEKCAVSTVRSDKLDCGLVLRIKSAEELKDIFGITSKKL